VVWGAGWVSAEHLQAWNNNPHCEVVAMGARRKEAVEKRLAQAKITGAAIDTD